MEVKVSEWGRNSRAVDRGPLVYALKLKERWEKGHDEKEGDYFCVYPVGNGIMVLLSKPWQTPQSTLNSGKQGPRKYHPDLSGIFPMCRVNWLPPAAAFLHGNCSMMWLPSR